MLTLMLRILKMNIFTLLPDLSPELQLKIWRSTSPAPRNVGIRIRIKEAGLRGWQVGKNSPPPPVTLQICHESRLEALKYYSLSFRTPVYPPTVYFNFQIDISVLGIELSPDLHPLSFLPHLVPVAFCSRSGMEKC